MPFKRLLVVLPAASVLLLAQTAPIDRDLTEVTVPQLEQFYQTHRYT